MSKRTLPVIVIVGRTNVGKSTLFNRLSYRTKSVTYDRQGVTRDVVTDTVRWQHRMVELIDTGGISMGKPDSVVDKHIYDQAVTVIADANAVVFVCDGTIGLVPEDRAIAKFLHKQGKPVIVVINKVDCKITQELMHEFDRLGFAKVIALSAQHGRGMDKLYASVAQHLPQKKHIVSINHGYRVAIVGKPNVGKSSLLNLLAQKERTLVADEAGTTREAIAEDITFCKQDVKLIDTPGVRRKRSVDDPLELLMVKSSLRSIDSADVVVLLVEAQQARMSDQELKLAFYAFAKKHKPLIIVFNKDDLSDDYSRLMLGDYCDQYRHLLDKVETLTISCKTGKNVGKVLQLVQKVRDRATTPFEDMEITMFLREQCDRRPLYRNRQELIFRTARRIETKSVPTFSLVVSHAPLWGESQLGYLENQLRGKYELRSVPVVFSIKTPRKS